MAGRVQVKTTYEAAKTIEPIYTGGDISSNADGTLIATCVEEDVLVVDLRSGKPLCRIEGDGEAVTNLCLAPDARHLVVCSRSLSVRIYAVSIQEDRQASTELIRTLKPHTTPVVSSAIDRTGSLLATGGADGAVKVWDIRGGFASHTFHAHGGVVSSICFFNLPGGSSNKPNGTSAAVQKSKSKASAIGLASGGEDGKIRIWSLENRKAIVALDAHVSVVRCLAYTENEGLLLSASRDRTIILWDIKTWKQRKVIPALEVIETSAFLLDGTYCYSGGDNGHIRIWSVSSGQEITPKQSSGLETDAIVNVIRLRNENILVSVHQDQNMKFTSYASLAESPNEALNAPLSVVRTISANLDEVIDMACVGPNRSMLALATNTESIKLVSIDCQSDSNSRMGDDVGFLEGHKDIVICMDIDWSGHWLATGAKDNSARLWRLDPAASSYQCTALFEGHTESLGAIGLPHSPPNSGKAASEPLSHAPAFLLTGSQDKTIKRWDTSKFKVLGMDTPIQSGARALYTRVAHEKDINAISVSSTAPLFATASQDRTIKIWSLEDGSVTGILRGHKRGVWSINFSPAGTPPVNMAEGGSSSSRGLLVSGSGDRTVKVWSLSTYNCLLTFEGHSNSVLKVIWLPPPSTSTEAPGEEDEDEEVINSRTTSRKRPHNYPIIASSSSDTLIKLWNPYAPSHSDHLLTTLDNHTDRVWALATPHTLSSSTTATPSTSPKQVQPTCPYPLISGAADASLTFWADTTSLTSQLLTTRATERIEQDQLLQNHIHAKNYREVITLCLALNHPGRLLRVFQAIVSLPEHERDQDSILGKNGVDDVLASLDEAQVFGLLERVRDWNTNAKTAAVAQRVLNCLLKSYPMDFFAGMARNRRLRTSGGGSGGAAGVKELLRGLEVYTERHWRRMEELVDEGYLMEYTLREMDEIAGTAGVEGVDGDVSMAGT